MGFFEDYYDQVFRCLNEVRAESLKSAAELIRATKRRGGKVIVVGNGGSAAMSSHVALDLTKVAGIRAITFNGADLLTCFANDFSYEHWVEKALEYYADEGDLAILISSSGTSPNIVNGAKRARQLKLGVITLSGFSQDNPLSSLGDVNLWADSKMYNIVEMTHHIWLLAVADYLPSATEYSAD